MMEPMWLRCRCAAGSSRRDGDVREATSGIEPPNASPAEEDTIFRDGVVEKPLIGPTTATSRLPPAVRQAVGGGVSIPRFACGALVVGMLVCAPVHLEPVRWWRSAEVLSALAITTDQSLAVEQLYEARLPSMRSVSENVMHVTTTMASRLRDGVYDDELLKLTENLITLRRDQCEQRRQLLRLSAALLTPEQREKLTTLIRAQRVME